MLILKVVLLIFIGVGFLVFITIKVSEKDRVSAIKELDCKIAALKDTPLLNKLHFYGLTFTYDGIEGKVSSPYVIFKPRIVKIFWNNVRKIEYKELDYIIVLYVYTLDDALKEKITSYSCDSTYLTVSDLALVVQKYSAKSRSEGIRLVQYSLF